jgi:AraC-like DNA-binding protein
MARPPHALHPAPAAATPIAFVHSMLLAFERYGQDPAAALREARITPAMLRRAGTRITAGQLETFSRHAMQQLDDEALGWFSRPLHWGSYGMLVRASLSAPDLGTALKRWCRHHRLLTQDLLFEPTVEGGRAVVRLREQRDFGAMREFCLLTSLRNLHGVACWLVDSRIPLQAVQFPFEAPQHRSAYPLLFPDGPVQFGAAQASMAFDAAYLALPVRRDERALQAMLQRALRLVVLPYRRDRLLVQRVRERLAADPSAGDATRLAEALHVSVRTLHRQLADEGASLQALKDAARRERAITLLRRSDMPLKQVAQAVGFRNDKSFARAFRGWTGQSPGAFREGAE